MSADLRYVPVRRHRCGGREYSLRSYQTLNLIFCIQLEKFTGFIFSTAKSVIIRIIRKRSVLPSMITKDIRLDNSVAILWTNRKLLHSSLLLPVTTLTLSPQFTGNSDIFRRSLSTARIRQSVIVQIPRQIQRLMKAPPPQLTLTCWTAGWASGCRPGPPG